MAENDENVVEYYSARLENLLTNCVNLFSIIEEHQYNCIIDAMQTFYFEITYPGRWGKNKLSLSAPVHGFTVGRPP